jgi:hypothetical protein
MKEETETNISKTEVQIKHKAQHHWKGMFIIPHSNIRAVTAIFIHNTDAFNSVPKPSVTDYPKQVHTIQRHFIQVNGVLQSQCLWVSLVQRTIKYLLPC